jgi:fatty-acyl-CoA synthase
LCAVQLARFKTPKEFVSVDKIRRLGNGKADYRWAKSQAVQHAPLAEQRTT